MYSRILSFILLVVVCVSGQEHNHSDHRVNVTVYYESLCSDSIKFFSKQLYPSLQTNLSKFVQLTLLPYGKSETKQDINNYEFTCHHGPGECHGNRLHACALRRIENGAKTENLGYNKVAVGFINCLMDKVKPSGEATVFPLQDCATVNNVQRYADIENCANDVEGSKFLNEMGVATKALQPALTSVPTIVFDGKFSKADNDLAQANFVKALCQHIKVHQPAECLANSAITHEMNAGFLTLFVLLVSAMLY